MPFDNVTPSNMDAVLIANGYEPIAVSGKQPVSVGWVSRPNSVEDIAAERAAHPGAMNTGLRTGQLVGLDIDLVPLEHVAAVKTLAHQVLGFSVMERIGNKGALLCYRNPAPIPKITIAHTIVDDSGKRKSRPLVEILGQGQQFVAYGQHPTTGRDYRWTNPAYGQQPLDTPLDALPEVTPKKLRQFAQEAAALLESLGYASARITDRGVHREAREAKRRAERRPVDRDYLERMLKLVPADEDRSPSWIGKLGAIQATNLRGVDEENMDAVLCEIAVKWSRGDYCREVPANWTGDDDVEHAYYSLSPDKLGGTTFGTLYHAARQNGWTEPAPDWTDAEKYTAHLKGEPTPEEAAAKRQGDREAVVAGRWPLARIRDRVTALNAPDPIMLVAEIIPDRKLIIPWGDTGCGKTYWSTEIATAVPMRRPAFGRFPIMKPGDPGIAVIFAGEDCDYLDKSRLTAIERHYERSLQGLVYTADTAIPVSLGAKAQFDAYRDELRRLQDIASKPIDVIVNDTLKRSLGSLKQNDDDAARRFSDVMEMLIVEFLCCVICNAHEPKSGPDAGIAGSGDFTANCPVTPHLIGQKNGAKQLVAVECRFEPKFRVGAVPSPFTSKTVSVPLPKPIAGNYTDLVLVAMSAAEEANQMTPAKEARLKEEADCRKIEEVLRSAGAVDLDSGLTTPECIVKLVGQAYEGESENDYAKRKAAWKAILDNGARRRPIFSQYFEMDHRGNSLDEMQIRRPVRRWFIRRPAE